MYQIEYELMGIDGVRAVNFVKIQQDNSDENIDGFSPPLYTYSMNEDGEATDDSDGNDDIQSDYGWKYDFSAANEQGIILPSHPSNPAVFELKNPNQNIKGVVR